MGENLLTEFEGKLWMRLGECIRCGECCLGWGKGPCPFLIKHKYDRFSCAIQENKSEIESIDGHDIVPRACAEFPAYPGDLSHIAFQNKCGYFFVKVPKVLVACPTYIGKEYAAEKWLNAVEAFDYPKQAYEVLWVDNSDNLEFYERWRERVPMVHLQLTDHPHRRIALSMDHIRKHFLSGNYDNWFNLEADIIAPPHTLKTMLEIDKGVRYDWLGLGYPCRDTGEPGLAAFGCTLFSRRIMEKHSFDDCPHDNSPDGWWWYTKIRVDPEMKVMEGWGIVPLEHLNA